MSRPDTAIDIGPFRFTHCSYDAGNDVAYLSIEAGGLLITFPDSVLPADRSPKESRKATKVPRRVLTLHCT